MDTPPADVSIDAALVWRLISAQHPSLLGGPCADRHELAARRVRVGAAQGWAVAEATAFLRISGDAPVLDAIGPHAVAQLLSDP